MCMLSLRVCGLFVALLGIPFLVYFLTIESLSTIPNLWSAISAFLPNLVSMAEWVVASKTLLYLGIGWMTLAVVSDLRLVNYGVDLYERFQASSRTNSVRNEALEYVRLTKRRNRVILGYGSALAYVYLALISVLYFSGNEVWERNEGPAMMVPCFALMLLYSVVTGTTASNYLLSSTARKRVSELRVTGTPPFFRTKRKMNATPLPLSYAPAALGQLIQGILKNG